MNTTPEKRPTQTGCEHTDDMPATYLSIMDPAGEIYMCACGALINISDASSYTDGRQQAMTPEELKKAISLIALEAIRHVKVRMLRAVNSIEQDWENKGK